MLGLLLAAVGAITVAASAVAWIFNELTSEQRARHEKLRARCRDLQAACGDELANHAEQEARTEREYALQIKSLLAAEIRRLLAEKADLERDLPALRADLERELERKHISAFKRTALRVLRTKLDDAIARLHAYRAYSLWYGAQLDKLVQEGNYSRLFDFELPEAKLPGDWFYVGKVGIVEREELNGHPNRYGQVLQLSQVKSGQHHIAAPLELVLAQSCPDQAAIPVQLVYANKSAVFFSASVLRGCLQVEHILERVPCKAVVEEVERKPQSGYLVRCYPGIYQVRRDSAAQGGILARLLRAEARYPGKHYQPGDVLDVYLLHYDLLLKDRRAHDSELMSVTERLESLDLDQTSAAPVCLSLDPELPHLDALADALDRDERWQLHASKEEADGRYLIDLRLGDLLVRTVSDPDVHYLQAHEIVTTDAFALQRTSLPFELLAIESEFMEHVYIDAQQYRTLRHFCIQQENYEQREAQREQAWNFFARWNRVADYLLEVDGHINVDLPLGKLEGGWLRVELGADSRAALKTLQVELEKDLAKGLRSRIGLHMACLDRNGSQTWIQVADLIGAPEHDDGACLLNIGARAEQSMQVDRHGLTPLAPRQLRLRMRKGGDFQNLQRQKQALDALVLDKLVNKSIKQILVDPAGYQGQPDARWEQKIAAGLEWHNEKWQESGKADSAKRVVEQALIESNLFLVQGPPGTGKTTSIVEILHQLYDDNPALRILVVSQQNAAVDNALTRFLKEAPAASTRVLRVGKSAKMDESLRDYGTEARLDAYYADRVAAYRCASAAQAETAPLLEEWLSAIRDDDGRFDSELSELLIGEYKLVGATCVGLAGQRHGLHRLQFDVAIIDEAGRSTVPELLIPMLRSRKVILIGDHYQLPPSIAATLREEDSVEALPFLEETFLRESFFELMYRGLPASCRGRLDHQYRMVEPIGDLVADLFYQEQGERGLFNGEIHKRHQFLDSSAPLRWYDVRGEQVDEGTSKSNFAEVEAIMEYLSNAAESLARRKLCKEVAIITPYGAQKRLVRSLLDCIATKTSQDSDIWRIGDSLKIRSDTVDSFQGSEADIVLYSTVRTAGDIRFIRDRQRLNVSCSRAKENLVFFGHADFLRRAEMRGQASGMKPLFGEIIQRSVRSSSTLAVRVQHIPKERSPFIFVQRGRSRYFAHFNVAEDISWSHWCSLKVGDALSIVLSDGGAQDGKLESAVSVRM